MTKTRLAEFGRIDQTADPDYFIRFLDAACAQASVQAYKKRLTEHLRLRSGVRVLDVGCGTGDDAREMASLVAPGGLVVGIDNSQAMIAEANKRAVDAELLAEFQVADVLKLAWADEAFDAVRADRSLMHVADSKQALKEMVRVTKAGGRVAVYEVDFETLLIDADDRVLARKIAHTWCDGFRNGWLGRHMPALLLDLGLKDITVEPFTLMLTPELAHPLLGATTADRAVENGTITAAEARAWLDHLETLQTSGRFLSSLSGFLVAGTK